ncbi:MAG: hypothetical protein M3Z82_07735 [Apilactobacillus sp.]|uniref:hypothetical protein n=1 Tax=Apilactobacillus kunkeei TaxID=148814 RepID=UPI002DDD70E7|nr:hypothetical protein [Apilactobacillus sp.]
MKLDINYPYPILSPFTNDFKIGRFDYECSYDDKTQSILLDCNLTNETIKDYIASQKMAYAVRISCTNSRYRDSITQFNPHFHIKLDKNNLSDTAEIDVFVVALTKIEDFDTKHLASIYKEFPVEYNIGDYVAAALSSKVDIEFDNKKSKSFIKYQKSNQVKDMDVNVTEDLVEILLSPSNYERYLLYRNNNSYSKLIFYAITVPALTSAIYKVVSLKDEFQYEECDWLKALVDKSDFEWDQVQDDISCVPLMISQTLENPTSSFFDALDSLEESEVYYD